MYDLINTVCDKYRDFFFFKTNNIDIIIKKINKHIYFNISKLLYEFKKNYDDWFNEDRTKYNFKLYKKLLNVSLIHYINKNDEKINGTYIHYKLLFPFLMWVGDNYFIDYISILNKMEEKFTCL